MLKSIFVYHTQRASPGFTKDFFKAWEGVILRIYLLIPEAV
jgi:hypothetical protein